MVGRQRCIIENHIHEEQFNHFKEFKIDVTVVNGQNMKCGIKGKVNMKL